MDYELLARMAADLIHTNQNALHVMWRAWNGGGAAANPSTVETTTALNIVLRDSSRITSQDEGKVVIDASDASINRVTPMRKPMYNLQKAKEEIDIVAKHTSVLTEHVIAVSERLQALESALATKLSDLKTLILSVEGKFSELQGAVVGGEPHHFETSAISDLASKLALLKPATAAHEEPSPVHGDDHHGHEDHSAFGQDGHSHDGHSHDDHSGTGPIEHQDNHDGGYHHG